MQASQTCCLLRPKAVGELPHEEKVAVGSSETEALRQNLINQVEDESQWARGRPKYPTSVATRELKAV